MTPWGMNGRKGKNFPCSFNNGMGCTGLCVAPIQSGGSKGKCVCM